MALDTIYEKSTYIITATFKDEDAVAVTPTSGKYWIYDITDEDAPVLIKAETAFTPTTSTHNFEVLPTENRILTTANAIERRELTAEFTYNVTRKGTSRHRWQVRNLSGLSGA